MAALADNYTRQYSHPGPTLYVVKNAAVLYLGALCCSDTNGEALPGADTAGLRFAGVNLDRYVDNADDGESVQLNRSVLFHAAGSGFTVADVGKRAYLTNDNTVALTSTHKVCCGVIVRVVSAAEVVLDPQRIDCSLQIVGADLAAPAAATSTDGTMAAAADLAAVKVEGEKIGDDVRALRTWAAATDALLKAAGLAVTPS